MRAVLVGGLARSSRNNNPLDNHLENNKNKTQSHDIANAKSSINSSTTTSTNATPSGGRISRPALQVRDSNAMMRVPPKVLGSKSGNANMPSYDKQNTQRPLMPTLSAAAKAPNRTPLTPRVAGSAPPTVSTPLSRRTPRPENTTPSTASREDYASPVSTFLSNNITPRSGSRRSRVDSANSTPTGTPTGTPAPQSACDSIRSQDAPVYGSGLGIAGFDKDLPKRPTVSFSPSVSEVGNSKNTTADSKFFFASEAKSVQPVRPPLQSKNSSSTFVYANGDSIPPPQSSSGSVVGSTTGEERSQPKFFHANGTLDLQSNSPHLPPPRPSSTVSSSSRMVSPRAGTVSPGTLSPPQRPSSPSKLNQYAALSSLRNAPSLPSPVTPRPQPIKGQSANSIVSARRASIEAVQKGTGHARSSSVGSTDTKAPPVRKISGGSSLDMSAPGTPLSIVTTQLPVSTPEEIPRSEAKEEPTLLSPIKTSRTLDELNELAANARRERKVLDLEITNSSLAAINRTLEREMRKQTAELRRYRRLSRSGRLSIATSASMRTSTDTLSVADSGGILLSDMSEEEEDEDESDFSEEDLSDEASLSPSAMAESDAKHRKRDEKRLQLDLSKHQQLLIDSQKMNQSLKRCLNWTEELINEGKKALDYKVRVSDIELGGRVLAPDEVEDVEGDNEGMSDIGARMLREARKAAANGTTTAAWGGFGKDDRDSGIELDGAQREQMERSFATSPQ